ncbi:MAG: transcription-repair coupling factor [Planctomycetota bacterium]|jgi:transcription-repair coupling factor (superfamily II helicase)
MATRRPTQAAGRKGKSKPDTSPVALLRATPSFHDLAARWRDQARGYLRWGGLWGSSKALLSAALTKEFGQPLLVVCADAQQAALAIDDLQAFGCGAVPFPARESSLGTEAEVLRERHHALTLADRDGFQGILVAPLAALIQAVPAPPAPGTDPNAPSDALLQLREGMSLDPEALTRTLVEAGFRRVPSITEAGEFARRGDILDFYAPAVGEPLRLEFFDEELESVRVFDLASQRTRHVLRKVEVPLTQELEEAAGADDLLPLERFEESLRVVVWEPAAVEERRQQLRFLGPAAVNALNRLNRDLERRDVLDLATLPGHDGTLTTLSVEEYCQGVAPGVSVLAERAADGEHATVLCSTDAEADRLRQILTDNGLDDGALDLHAGGLDRGFRIPEARLTVLHHREFVPGHGSHRPKPRRRRDHPTEAIETVMALRPGDLVVHLVHGLALFRGLDASEGGSSQDFILLEFDGGAELKVPVSRVDLVERFIGAGGANPELDRLGSGAFERRRSKVEAAVEDLAAEMIEIQAKREAVPGFAFPEIDKNQLEFEASFPWEDTPDQAQGTREIHADLSLPRAMDRLLCGDVGYGKTELAARAAFRAILAGKQVALLVPTTVLAEQHWRSFQQRFADWPVEIGLLSRLVTPQRKRETLAGLADGSVDLVIGTHRILSKDVVFKDLGLVVIDEEQRFGVRHKELLKQKRAQVDVLTLTATPVPRTLHMAMAGIRDITSLSTAPVGRQEVHTEIRYDDEAAMVTEVLRRELARGGQVFFLHNRVKSLELMAERLRRMVPEAKVVTGHGQMEPKELEKVMLQFVRGKADILCATTIIESGLDIPNANTILVDQAQRHGLADLHQLRGRVGRSDKRGYCYLMIPRGKPLPLDARRRLKAIEEMKYLGAGFQLAMRDLEIRGAGNLLGSEQSGHINAVGYETYRRLLAQAVARFRRQGRVAAVGLEPACDLALGVDAALSPEFVPDEDVRLQLLREFDRVRAPKEVDAVLEAVRDRFGPPPEDLTRLARLFFLKHRLGLLGLDALQRVGDHLVCSLREAKVFERALKDQNIDLRILTARKALWMLPEPTASPEEVLDLVFATAVACRIPRNKRKSATGKRP